MQIEFLKKQITIFKRKIEPGTFLFGVIMIVVGTVFPILIWSTDQFGYLIDLAINVLLFIMLATGLNIVVGFSGLLVMGYIAFYAIGAYFWAFIGMYTEISFWVALPLAGAVAGVFGLILGLPTLRLRGDYLAIVTLGFGEIIRLTVRNLDITGGPNGISPGRNPVLGFLEFSTTNYTSLYYLTFVILLILLFITYRLDNSRIGRAWVAMREDEVAASAMGINVFWMKLLAFGVGSIFAGLAGAVFAVKIGNVSPDSFEFMQSVFVLCMVILGGMGTISGSIVGAILITIVPELLRNLGSMFSPDAQDFIEISKNGLLGISLILLMVFRPQGIVGSSRKKRELVENVDIIQQTDEQLYEVISDEREP